MKQIFTHQNPILLSNFKNLLENRGIATVILNEYASGGVGELSFVDAWPQLWVLHDDDYIRACKMLEALKEEASEWLCPNCHETNDSSFEVCWQCGSTPDQEI